MSAVIATRDLFDEPPPRVPVDPPRARHSDPDTSHIAAAKAAPGVRKIDAKVLDALQRHPGGLTSLELAEVTGIERVCVSPRLRPLERAGYVVETRERRLQGNGARGIVWRIARGE